MNAPPRVVRALFAWLGYSSVHWAAGRWQRALAWDALLVATLLAVAYVPVWALVAIIVAQIVDAAVIRPARDRSTGMYAVAMLIAMCVGVLVQTTLRTFWVEAFRIPAGSMVPTLLNGDHIWIAKTARTPQRGDVIVFRYPREPDKDFIKRVIAVGGDTIELRDQELVLNGTPIARKHVDAPCEYDDDYDGSERKRRCDAWDETLDGRTYRVIFDSERTARPFAPVTVAPGAVYVLGDNRDNSHDSRYWGFVAADLIKGTARTIWWSSGPGGVRWSRHGQRIR